jgi:hypothetical protein
VVFPPEKIGILGGTTRSYIPKTGGEITLEGVATFEQLGYVFNSGIKHVTPTTDLSSAQIRTWAAQFSDTDPIATTDLDTMVIESGDNQQAEIMRYAFVDDYTITGRAGEALEVSAHLAGRAVAPGTFTAGLAIPTVEDILFSKGRLYIDPSTDTPGTTEKSNTLLEMSLHHVTGWMSKQAADGRLDFSFIKRAGDEITLDITFEHNATAVAEKAAWLLQTERVIQLKFTGSALTTTDVGAPYDTKTYIVNIYGKWLTFDALDEQDGNNIVKGTFHGAYSPGAAGKLTHIIANELATLP